MHVKGHSDDPGNDRADDLFQWGKTSGPYTRYQQNGTGEGDGAGVEEELARFVGALAVCQGAATSEASRKGGKVHDVR